MRVTETVSPVWVLVTHSEEGREPGLVQTYDTQGNIRTVLVRNCTIMRVPDEAEVLGPIVQRELARLLGIDRG